ncbi:signal peptidase I [Candidatus Roizmanbacteria bacterium]|nr:signal peptidase I [Candidatus Roizmanbacteria bacterium]
MSLLNSQKENSYKTRQIITIIFLLLTFIKPLLGVIGIILMWLWMKWKVWIKIIITLPYLVIFVFAPLLVINYLFFMKPVQIKGSTMLPNYKAGEYYISIVLNKNSEIKRGDVVIFTPPTNSNIDYIKRVIALPYEKIVIREGNVYVNGELVNENKYLQMNTFTRVFPGGMVREGEEIVIPDNSYFVMGDNRKGSVDSRDFGPISRDLIKSKVVFCYFNCK